MLCYVSAYELILNKTDKINHFKISRLLFKFKL